MCEVNSAGLRYPVQEIYPGPELLQIFFAHGLPVTLGSDAHRPEDVGAGLPQALELIKCGLPGSGHLQQPANKIC